MDNKKTNIFIKVVRVLSIMFLVLLFVLACFLIYYIITNMIAKKTGTKPPISIYTIASPSMEPTIMVYDVIVNVNVKSDDELFAPSANNEGTIITFYSDVIDTGGYTITHRINKKYESQGTIYYETKGDNNNSVDNGRITLNNIVGKLLFKIPQAGRIQVFLSSKFGWLLIILIPALCMIFSDILKIHKAYKIREDISKLKDESNKEVNRDKRIRALIEKADKINKK